MSNDREDNRTISYMTGNFDLAQDLRNIADEMQSCVMTLRLVSERIDEQANDNDD